MHHVGYAFRLIYFLVVPFMLIASAMVLPLTGVLINFILLIGGFLAIDLLRNAAERSRIARFLVRRQLFFAEYYQANPPRPFAYYVFYGALAPYWLFNRNARREFTLYRGFTRLSIVLLAVLSVLDYFRDWAPEIGFGKFLSITLAMFILQIFALVVFMMPLATTLVTYQLAGRRRSIYVLLGAAVLSTAFAALGFGTMTGREVMFDVATRTQLRTEAVPDRAHATQDAVLTAAWQAVRAGTATIDASGWISGDTLDRAHTTLMDFYRPDEADAFTLHVWPVDNPTHMLLQCHENEAPIWRAMNADASPLTDASQIPADLFNAKRVRTRKQMRGE